MTTKTDPFNPDFDQDYFDGLDDFDSKPLWQPSRSAGHTYLDGMWDRYGFRVRSGRIDSWGHQGVSADDIVIAHGMVQSFLNSFSPPKDGRYELMFNESTQTAGTDMRRQVVIVTPAPIVDQNLTPQEAGRVLTGLAVHEISHPRYGKDTSWAVRQAFPGSKAATKLSNLLDDVRIEQRFIEDYPGYAGVFKPTLKYIADGMVARNGGKLLAPKVVDQLNVAIMAVRYEDAATWRGPKLRAERDWWKEWARKWSQEDSPRRHVEAIREALRHIVQVKLIEELLKEAQVAGQGTGQGTGQQGPGGGQGAGEEGDEDADQDAASDGSGEGSGGDEKIDAEGAGGGLASDDEILSEDEAADKVSGLDDEELGATADEGDPTDGNMGPSCSGSQSVENSAKQQGTDALDIKEARDTADEAIENAKYYEDDGHGRKVDVARSLRNLINSRYTNRMSRYFSKSDIAARYIRDAVLQSRTGHTDVARYQKRGRLDEHGLHRVARRDFRLFDRKTAVSPGKYLIWMMLDRSGSMDGNESVQAAQVATAIADAMKHVKTVRAAVWAWSDSFRRKDDYYGAYGPGVAKCWETGQPTSEIARSIDLRSGGTPDSQIMSWAARAIRREAKRGEQPVIIFCSDGWGADNLGERVAEARAMGVEVVSVAFGSLDVPTQQARFGRDGFVAWQGNIISTARPLARMIARLVGRDRRRG